MSGAHKEPRRKGHNAPAQTIAGVPVERARPGHPHRVRDVMTPNVVAVTGVTFLPEAARIMREEDIGALPVVHEDHTLVGILTDRDIAVRAVAAGLDPRKTHVAEVCTKRKLITTTPDATLLEAEAQMAENQVRRLPVLESGEKLVGMIALADLAPVASGDAIKELMEEVCRPGGAHTQHGERGA